MLLLKNIIIIDQRCVYHFVIIGPRLDYNNNTEIGLGPHLTKNLFIMLQ